MRRTTAIRTLVLAVSAALAACGRIGVDTLAPDGTPMPPPDGPPDAPPDAPPPPPLACSAPVKLSLGNETDGLFATATPGGYAVFIRDASGRVAGFTYDFDGTGVLQAGVVNKPIASEATDLIIPLAMGTDLLVAMPYGIGGATGTDVFSLDAQLVPRTSAPARYDRTTPPGGLVRNDQGIVALLTQTIVPFDSPDDELTEARPMLATGTQSAAPAGIPAATNSDFPSLVSNAKGFVATWFAPRDAQQGIKAVRLDNALAVTSSEPILISTDLDASQPRAAYLAAADRYLFVWFRKNSLGDDQILMTLRNGDLSEIPGIPAEVLLSGSKHAFEPMVIAGSDDFIVAWENVREDGVTFDVDAVRVNKKGEFVQPTIARNGGDTVAWDLVVKDGQPALVWLEVADPAPSLRFDPLCMPLR